MKNQYLGFILFIFSINSFAVDQACIDKLASAPYCLMIASAELNCEKFNTEMIGELQSCIIDSLPEFSRDLEKREIINSLCLGGSAISPDESKNKSKCRTQHFESSLNDKNQKNSASTGNT